jgi:hypothetical protein
MATTVWEAVDTHWCELQRCEATLLEERVYAGEAIPESGPRYFVRARKCSLGLECNLAGYSCRWAWTNPELDPFAMPSL